MERLEPVRPGPPREPILIVLKEQSVCQHPAENLNYLDINDFGIGHRLDHSKRPANSAAMDRKRTALLSLWQPRVRSVAAEAEEARFSRPGERVQPRCR